MTTHYYRRPTANIGSSKGWQRSTVQSKRSPCILHGRLSSSNSIQFKDLGLSGLSTITDPTISSTRKLTWGLLWLMALICCIVGCTNCIITYTACPFTVDVKFKNNNSMTTPHVTLCPGDYHFRSPAVSPVFLQDHCGETSYSNASELLLTCNMSIESLWNISRFETTREIYHLYEVSDWLAGDKILPLVKVERIELQTIHGTCWTFKMNSPLSCMGMQNGLDIKGYALSKEGNASSMFYTGIIHSAAEIPIVRYAGTFSSGFYAAYKQLTTVALRVEQLIDVNTWIKPCQSEETYLNCFIHCIEKEIITASKLPPCRLPYMDEKLNLPSCKTVLEFLNMYNATQQTVKHINPSKCGCIQPCKTLRYIEDYFLNYPVDYLFGLYLILPRCDIQVIEETLTYDFTSLLSDIGGYLGLFMGMSVLSILEVLEVLFFRFISTIDRRSLK